MTELFQYQKKGVRKISHFKGRCLLADEMGLGKTLQALYWVHEKPEERMPALVICPAHLKSVWSQEAAHHLNIMSQVLQGRKAEEDKLELNPKLIIINYDILKDWIEYLSKIKIKTALIDESHFIKNPKRKRTKACRIITKEIPYTIAMSGTPLVNKPAEIWQTLNIIRPDKYKSFWTFAHQYCQLRKDRWGWRYDGAKNMKGLHAELTKHLMIRRRKADVLPDLPDKRRQVIPLEIENRKEYDKAKNNFIEWLSAQSMEKAEKAGNAEQLVKLGYLKRLAAELKLNRVMDWVDNFLEESDGKLVLFAIHQKIIEQLQTRYKKHCVTLHGKTPAKQKKKAVEIFQNKKDCRLFIGNIQAAGTGITLTAASSLAFAEIGWTPGEHTQAEDRIHRIGQKNAAMIYYLIADNTIEDDIVKILEKKFGILTGAMEGTETTDFNIWEQLKGGLLK